VLLRPGLVLSVSVIVFGKKEIDEPAKRITDAGDITLPLLGKIHVEGLTLEAVSAGVAELYKEYFVQPRVVVEFNIDNASEASTPWGYVTVLGRVTRPGRVNIPATRDLTVSGAIQRAGGLSSSARESSIRVSRRKTDGKTETLKVDLRSVGTEGKTEHDIVLQSGDVVFVPENMF
jgi:polysaccharide biosynthesis/export protein